MELANNFLKLHAMVYLNKIQLMIVHHTLMHNYDHMVSFYMVPSF